MFEELLKQWAKDQGFDGWSQDHAAVLRNLGKWLNQNAAQQSVQRVGGEAGVKLTVAEDQTFPPIENFVNPANR